MSELSLDPKIVPWSIRGSFMSLAALAGLHGKLTPDKDMGNVYIVNHRYSLGVPLLSLRPVEVDSPVEGYPREKSKYALSATPGCLLFGSPDAVAEITWQDYRTLRLRGKGRFQIDIDGKVGVDGWRNWLNRVPPKGTPGEVLDEAEVVFTPNAALRIGVVKGQMKLENDAPYGFDFTKMDRRVTISGEWEIVISEVERDINDPLPISGPKGTFDQCRRALDDGFDTYVKAMCPWGANTTDRLACYIMFTSTIRKSGYLTCEAVLMSKLWMNKVWSWDNCFNGLALAAISTKHALDQILLPYQHQTPEGRLPDSLMPEEALYDYTKPPIYGWTFFTLLSLIDPKSTVSNPSFSVLDKNNLVDILDKVGRFTDFWFNSRSTRISALPYYVHGNDSGWDNATCYDSQTVCVSPDLAAFLVVQADFLAKLANHLGKDDKHWVDVREKTLKGLVDELWDEKTAKFLFKDAFNGNTWSSTSLLQYLPIVASPYLPDGITDKLAKGITGHLTEWGLATEHPSSPKYEPDGYWRGPIWAPPTFMIEWGLRQSGNLDLANAVLKRFTKLCDASGFAENYNALTGEGNRDLSYTWAASAYLALRRQSEERKRQR